MKTSDTMAKKVLLAPVMFAAAAAILLSGCSLSLPIPGLSQAPAVTLAAPDYVTGLNSIGGALAYDGRQPPYRLYPGGPMVKLVNNPSAVDVTWDRLMTFVESDATDRNAYLPDKYMCGSFAMDLHNDAEAAGIRAGWVAIDFYGEDVGHAATAFMTTDRGLVIIDDTSSYDVARQNIGDTSADSFDKVAYIAIGQDYGVMPLEVASSPLYNYYLSYLANFASFEQKRAAYEADAVAYEQALGGRTRLKEPEYSYFTDWHNRLQSEKTELNALGESLGSYYWPSLGTVSSVDIYW
jgi:hypothetical protein